MGYIFKKLDVEEPDSGLFFFEARNYPVAETTARATGLGLLIGDDGLVVTCAHVLLVLGSLPGSKVALYGAGPDVPIVVEAEVLEAGWRGPDWRQFAENALLGENIWSAVDLRPDLFQEDIAFLRILPSTARWDTSRGFIQTGDPEKLLLDKARVLPLGVPGYRHASEAPLKCWHVAWDNGAPHLRPEDAKFLGAEPRLHGIIRFRSETITHGNSGAPLWDTTRCRVVGMVRRGIRTTLPDRVLGVDSRVIALHAGIQVWLDAQASQLLDVLVKSAEARAPLRHFPLLRALIPTKLLDLKVHRARSRDLLENSEDGNLAEPAIASLMDQLVADSVVVLSGGAGAGKSTLLHTLSSALLTLVPSPGTRRFVPVFVHAVEFERHGFDIGAILDEEAAKYGWDARGKSLIDAFDLNDLSPLVLLDGLDEIDRIARARVLARLGGVGAASRSCKVVVATRPIDDLRIAHEGRTSQGWPVFELQHLTDGDVAMLSSLWFQTPEKVRSFVDTLNEVSWDRRGATPLQIAAAANLFRSSNWTPERPIDLTFQLVDHFLALGQEEAKSQVSKGILQRTKADALYLDNLRPLLRRLGRISVDRASQSESLIQTLRKSGEEAWLHDPPELIRFLLRETTLLGGLVIPEPALAGDWVIVWPHRTIAEALAAEDIASVTAFNRVEGFSAFQAGLRSQGQAYAITVLAAMDRSGSTPNVELALSRTLTAGASDFSSTLLAVRSLGAGIRVSDDLRRRLMRTFISLLLMPEGARLGAMRCSEVFSTDDLPNPIDIARRPHMRSAIIEQLHERWAARDPRGRGKPPPLYLSEREAALLDRLAMWSDIHIPVARRESAPSLPLSGISQFARIVDGASLNSAALSAALLAHAIRRLQDDADSFFTGFANFARGAGAKLPPETAARAYISRLMSGSGAEQSQEIAN